MATVGRLGLVDAVAEVAQLTQSETETIVSARVAGCRGRRNPAETRERLAVTARSRGERVK
jgi:hypothetical protein